MGRRDRRNSMSEMSIPQLVTKLESLVDELESAVRDIADDMESLDMESKDFQELDFEYNHLTGLLMGYNQVLKMISKGE
jgi:hypothetical protein